MIRDASRCSRDSGISCPTCGAPSTPSVSEADVVAMVAQHLVTGPVFQALFANYEFATHNPVSRALDRLVGLLEAEGLENETRDLEPFYESVRRRARHLDNADARQTVLLELYERFFSVALRKDAERLGIVYTPVELVDFLLQSADDALRRHLGRSLSDANVHILDPFTGTGTFIVRLLQNPELIRDEDLVRKFTKELHANEIVLLAYYIAAINIEEACHGRLDSGAEYRPFDGIALADTFTLSEGESQFAETMPDNSERVKAQQDSPVQVIVGNPPYSVGQRDATDDNPNVVYPLLFTRVSDTYVAHSTTTIQVIPLRQLQAGPALVQRSHCRQRDCCLRDQCLVPARQRGSRCARLPGGRVCRDLRVRPAGQSAHPRRDLAARGRQGVWFRLSGADRTVRAGQGPGTRGTGAHPLPGHR